MIGYNLVGNGGIILQNIFGIVAGIFAFVAYIVYAKAILRGSTKPSRMTWIIIALMSWILLLSYRFSGADTTIWVLVGEAFVVSFVAVISIKRGVGGTDKTDIVCLLGAIGSLFLWWIFNSSVLGLVASLTVDSFALWPTIKKSLKTPSHEDKLAWTLTEVSNTINLFAINRLIFGVVIFPVWRFLLDGIVIYALYRKRK